MAITIDQLPNTSGTPAYNPVIYVVDSNNKTQDNFQYVADVYVTGVSGYKRLKAPAHPDYGCTVFNFSGILKNYVSFDWDYEGSSNVVGSYATPNSAKQYTIKFGEEYGASSGTTVYANLSTTSGMVFNSIFDYPDFVNYSFNPFNPDNNASSKILSTAPRYTADINGNVTYAPTINHRQINYLYFCNYNNECGRFRVTTYFSKNTSDVQASYTVYLQPTYNDFKDSFIKVDAGYNLNYINPIYAGGTSPVLGAGIEMFSIQFYRLVGSNRSEILYYYYNHDGVCSINPVWTLYFQNKYGGFDTFTFSGAPSKKANIEKKSYKKTQGTQTADAFTYSTQDYAKATYHTLIRDELKLISDWVTEDEHAHLEELVTSPVVFGVKDYDYTNIYSLTVKNTSWDEKTVGKDMLFNIEILCEFSFTRNRQSW